MDYLIFFSKYSNPCQKLFEEFPGAFEKSVMVDSPEMRKYIKKLQIVCVPTLAVILGGKIIERVTGFDSISNWLLIAIYRSNQLQVSTQPQPPASAPNPPPSLPPQEYIHQQPQYIMQQSVQSPSPPQPVQILHPQQHDFETSSLMVDRPQSAPFAQTNLDDLLLEDINEPGSIEDLSGGSSPKSSSLNTIQRAEALKKERDNLDPKGKKSVNFERS